MKQPPTLKKRIIEPKKDGMGLDDFNYNRSPRFWTDNYYAGQYWNPAAKCLANHISFIYKETIGGKTYRYLLPSHLL